MIKYQILKTIVNENKNIIGFVIKERDSSGLTNEFVERPYSVSNLIASKFSNHQLAVVNGKLVEKGTFKMNSIPMLVLKGNNYIEIDNTIDLVGRFVQNNKNVGFTVKFFDNSKQNLTYSNLVILSKWFKPGNFIIRTSANNKIYVAGKKDGIKIEDLPVTVIGENKSKAKRTKSGAQEKPKSFSGLLENNIDMLDICDLVSSCGGELIKLPGESYKAATPSGAKELEEFIDIGVGEVASPSLKFNSTKINVNAGFKKVGMVGVDLGSGVTNITTYVNRTKSIFLNGDNYIKKLGIAVPSDKANSILDRLGKTLSISQISDKRVTQPLSQVIGSKSLSFFELDTSKVDLISEDKRRNNILSSKQLKELCLKQYELKLMSKYLGPNGGVLKEVKLELSKEEQAKAKHRSTTPLFSAMSEEAKSKITEAGIDIYTGAYLKVGTTVVNNKDGKEEGSKSASEEVEIIYIIKGFDANKITGKEIREAAKNNNTAKIPKKVIELVQRIESIKSPVDKYEEAYNLYNEVEKQLSEIGKKFWCHNASMFINGGKKRVHSHDKDRWEQDLNTRAKKYEVYKCKDIEGLTLSIKGIAL